MFLTDFIYHLQTEYHNVAKFIKVIKASILITCPASKNLRDTQGVN